MKVIDLFAGVGGLSLGAARAGFELAAAVELDPIAVRSHAKNFPNSLHFEQDVSMLNVEEILRAIGSAPGEICGVVGGPPCQGFSYMGRRDTCDPRNQLFGSFFDFVKKARPSFFLAENVPGILSDIYAPIRENALSIVRDDYHLLQPIKIKASDFGAPTTRTRVFFIGIRKDYPETLLAVDDLMAAKESTFVTVAEALSGMPEEIDPSGSEDIKKTKPEKLTAYLRKISSEVPKGVGNADAVALYEKRGLSTGNVGTAHTAEILTRYRKLGPGQTDSVSKAKRLDPKGLCPTIRAGTGRDKGSHQAIRPIHPTQPRVITPREAARLQGFPDWFVFHETKWHSFRQIGNSVSPIVAQRILESIRKKLI